jgi:O-antigen/teichoic acid export membrane protein
MTQKLKKNLLQTLIYTLSLILSKGISVIVTPYLTKNLPSEAEFGQITYFYTFMAIFVALLSFGLETSFFFFKNKNPKENVEGNMLSIHLLAGTFLLALGWFFAEPISLFLTKNKGFENHFKVILGIVWIDLAMIIPFAKLRYQKRPIRYGSIRILHAISTLILLQILFVSFPNLVESQNPEWLGFYDKGDMVLYFLLIGLMANIISILFLIPEYKNIKFSWNPSLNKTYLRYGIPVAIGSLAYIINEQADSIFIKFMLPDDIADNQLGIYKANYRVAGLLGIIITGYRLGIEPFFFQSANDKDAKKNFALVLDIFIIFTILGALFILMNQHFVEKYYIESKYYSGFKIVPIVLLAYIFSGIYNNLSVWYKLIDKTRFGMYFTLIGASITLILNFIFVPKYGYISSAWITLVCYISMCFISYFLGQKNYPINYNLKRILTYLLSAFAIYFISLYFHKEQWVLKNLLLFIYILIIGVFERKMLLQLIKRNG